MTENNVATYDFDYTELERSFPSNYPIPPLLKAWGEWLATQPIGGLGDIDFHPQPNDHIVGAQNHDKVIPLLIGDNFEVFFWCHDNVGDTLPVVAWESSGESETFPSLEVFLARLASDYFELEDSYLSNLIPEIIKFEQEYEDWEEDDWDEEQREEYEAERARLAPDTRYALEAWLLAYTNANSLEALINVPPAAEKFHSWWDEAMDAQTEELNRHPAVQAIAEAMTQNFAIILWVDDHYRAVIGTKGSYMPPYRDLPNAEVIKPYVQQLREEWAEKYPGLGLWHSATFESSGHLKDIIKMTERLMDERSILQKGLDLIRGDKPELRFDDETLISLPAISFTPYYNYIYPTEMEKALLPKEADFGADEARYPRAPHRIPKWLRERLTTV